jgi:histidine phosphotransfer protein HptB
VKTASPTTTPRQTSDGLALIDEATVQQLRRDVGVHRLREALGAFMAETERRMPLVRAAIEKNDLLALGRESHSLKGSALTFGAPALAAAARQANEAFGRNDGRALLEASAEVLRRGPETCAAVEGLIATIAENSMNSVEGDVQ